MLQDINSWLLVTDKVTVTKYRKFVTICALLYCVFGLCQINTYIYIYLKK